MKPLEPPDCLYLKAAEGWLELNNHQEANAELDKITPTLRAHPDVLEMHWKISAATHKWGAGLLLAETIIQIVPDRPSGWLMKAMSLSELERHQEAWETLLPVADKFPHVAGIAYDLACYACRLGRLKEAQGWLVKAFSHQDARRWKLMALEDPDLEALWKDIGTG